MHRFARDSGLPLSVRGGGHNIAGTALCDGGVMIDFSTHEGGRGRPVDPRRCGCSRAPPGSTSTARPSRSAWSCRGGIVSATGVAGFTLGGGFGWVSRRFGFDRRQSARGRDRHRRRRRCAARAPTEHPDLFWAIRGGGGNFGVVTAFEFEAQPHGPEVVAGLVLHPMDRAKEVMALFREADREGAGRALPAC